MRGAATRDTWRRLFLRWCCESLYKQQWRIDLLVSDFQSLAHRAENYLALVRQGQNEILQQV